MIQKSGKKNENFNIKSKKNKINTAFEKGVGKGGVDAVKLSASKC
jgi:hypothetical protein